MGTNNLFTTPDGKNHLVSFLLLTCLFLVLGFSTGLIDVLNKHFQNTLNISKAESALVQFANYLGYFFMAIPAGIVARKMGYKFGILSGLVLIAAGAFCFILASRSGDYLAFLLGLFILATGLTCIETIANPYAAIMGTPGKGASRLNLSQSVTGIGLILGPLIGGHFILSSTGDVSTSNDTLIVPYLLIGVAVLLLSVVFLCRRMPDITPPEDSATDSGSAGGSLWSKPHFVLAVVVQFFYVAGQTGIFSFFINYVVDHSPLFSSVTAQWLPASWSWHSAEGWRFTERGASQLLAFGGFGLFMLGRFTGGLLLSRYQSHKTLAVFSLINCLLMVVTLLANGWVGIVALTLSFYFMSIMFPTIFALGIAGLGARTKQASSYLVMAIVGGAVMPMVMGAITDKWSMSAGFIMPLTCFVIIGLYALYWRRLKNPPVNDRLLSTTHS
ncbi:sugar MFS transporter [Tatumella citrea]|uniref:MFS transporter n=1 Tax=Tatumella citrea TaxID=53336 RepID=A0A1Y0LFA4_TATCI|nr:sugar MFS transporter [Tatumella citrea]ARU92728.1 MFS transporter [Tatumella citrea]ARU96766.1 MFS transporter [Tatumella citrea]